MFDIVIIGSGPAGLSAAIYAKRAMLKVLLLEKQGFGGGQIISSHKVDNYLGLPEMSGFDLALAFCEHAQKLGVEIESSEVVEIQDKQEYKEVIHLYYYMDYNTDEIAKLLGTFPSTVRSRLTRARSALEKILKGGTQK